jgi:hypothetical protein
MVKTKQPPEARALAPLREWISEEMRSAVLETQYDRARELENAEAMIEGFLNGDSTQQREQRRAKAAEKLAVTKERSQSITNTWSDKIERWRGEQNTRLLELEEAHRQQLEEFERRWEDPVYLLQFNKPSPQVLGLRHTQANLAMLKQFEHAQRVKAQADRLERQETISARNRAITTMRLEYDFLVSKQRKEIECLREYTNRIVDVMEQDKNRELQPFRRISDRLTDFLNTHPPRERKKEFVPTPIPPSPRPLHGILPAQSLHPHTLKLAGIQVRQHIKVTKRGKAP